MWERIRRFLNIRVLARMGHAIIPLDVLTDMLSMIVAYRIHVEGTLEPNQVIIYDRETRRIDVVIKR